MLLITGFQFGENRINLEALLRIFQWQLIIILFKHMNFRTRQEEMRVYQRDYNSSQSNEFSISEYGTAIPSEATDLSYTLSTDICIYVHGAIMASLFLLAISRSIGFYSICVRASQNLHNAMFNGLISTTMRFFDTNPSGRILNRFSKDIG